MISRRRFFIGGFAIAAIGGLGVVGFGRSAMEARIAAVLRGRLGFLQLDPDGVAQFAKDQAGAFLARKVPTLNRMRYHVLSAVAPSFNRYYRSNDHRSHMQQFEDPIISTYLLSSDFFIHGSDESRVIRYVAFFDPMRACSNPFARPVLAGTSA
jgi:hypothetical protein